jgi:RNA polymerase sigma factor (sigma-70 family)
VRGAAARVPGAFDGLVDRFGGLVWAVARSQGLSPADAADVSQTTWLRLTEHLRNIRDPERVGGWLATTARNEALRTLKRSARQVPVEPDGNFARPVGADEPGLDQALLDDERDAALWRAFDALPPPCKLLLRTMIVEPAPSYAEISQTLEIPVGSIGPRRSRCLEHLRRDPGVRVHEGGGTP